MKENQDRYQVLDAFRGIAAVLVMLAHFTYLKKFPFIQNNFFFGFLGVDLFFMISGFVIYLSVNKVQSSKEFLLNRFIRLYPTYWVCVSIACLIGIYYCIQTNRSLIILLKEYLFNLTMLQHIFNIRDLDSVYWTLFIELLFYIFIAILYNFNFLKNINLICVLALCFIGINSYVSNTKFELSSFYFQNYIRIFQPFFTYLSLFIAGILFYSIKSGRNNNYISHILILLTLIAQLSLYDFMRHTERVTLVEYGTILLIFYSLFYLFVYEKLNFITNFITLLLGKVSYSLYLTHQLWGYIIIIKNLIAKGFHPLLSVFTAIGISIFLAFLITQYIEIPSIKLLKAKPFIKKLYSIG